MRIAGHRVNAVSLLSTAVVAAAMGISSVAWEAHVAPGADVERPAAAAEGSPNQVRVALEPMGDQPGVGQSIDLRASFDNGGGATVATDTDAGVFDLSVQRLSSPEPSRLGETSFLAVCEVGAGAPKSLEPGQKTSHELHLTSGAPFDEPGLYRISGAWRGSGVVAAIAPFDLRVEGPVRVASRTSSQRGSTLASPPGA